MATRTQLYRALSKLGICSRTEARLYIEKKLVCVNNATIDDPLVWVDYEKDHIYLKTIPVKSESPHQKIEKREERKFFYILVNKPKGYITTRRDELDRLTIYNLLQPPWDTRYLFPVGRLDKDSEGVIVMTNNGKMLDTLTDPLTHVPKTYRVLLNHFPLSFDLDRIRNGGMILDGTPLLPALIEHEKGRWYRITLFEGRNRQIRRVFHAIGCKVERLIRIAIGPLTIDNLKPGEVRELTAAETRTLTSL